MSDNTDDLMLHVKAATGEPAEAVVARISAAMPGLAKGKITLADPLPPGVTVEPLEDFMARGRAPDCDCGLIQCACARAREHTKDCAYRKALTCAIAIECEHGFDVCPTCDACDCGGAGA